MVRGKEKTAETKKRTDQQETTEPYYPHFPKLLLVFNLFLSRSAFYQLAGTYSHVGRMLYVKSLYVIVKNCKTPRTGRSVMHFRRTELPHARSFLAMILAFSTILALARNAPAQGVSGTADFAATAKSATAAREAGRADEAIRAYRRAEEINPTWEEGWWYLGTLLYDADRYSEAIPAFQK